MDDGLFFLIKQFTKNKFKKRSQARKNLVAEVMTTNGPCAHQFILFRVDYNIKYFIANIVMSQNFSEKDWKTLKKSIL